MGSQFLIDTNAVIDFFKEELPRPGIDFLSAIYPKISIITYIELFSKSKVTDSETSKIEKFVDTATIYYVENAIAEETIRIRKKYKLKLPDAIIAATAIYYSLSLVTKNVDDFVKIVNLKIIDPYHL